MSGAVMAGDTVISSISPIHEDTGSPITQAL
jgi:hypothetical protein